MNRYRPNEYIINLGYARWSVGPGPWHGSGQNFWGWDICLWVYSPYHMISSLPRTPLAGWGYILLSPCSLFMLYNLFGCYFLLMHRSEVFIEFRRKASLSAIQCPGLLSSVTCGKTFATLPNCYCVWKAGFGIFGSQLWPDRQSLPAGNPRVSSPWWPGWTLAARIVMAVAEYEEYSS